MNSINLTQFRNLKQTRFVSLVTAILFSLTLIQVPLVSASELVNNQTGVPTPTVSATQPVQTQIVQPVPQDPTAAFSSGNTLSIATEVVPTPNPVVIEPVPMPIQPIEPPQESCLTSYCVDPPTAIIELPPPVSPEDHFSTAAKEMAVNDLINSFGFTREMLDDLIKKGLIKFEVDFKSLQITVHIDPSVKLPDGALNLTDLLGSNKLPGKIIYQLGQSPNQIMAPCFIGVDGGGGWCPPTIYQLERGSFQIGERHFELDYLTHPTDDAPFVRLGGDNRLQSVKIYDGDPRIVCITAPCPTGKLVKEITYEYNFGFPKPYPLPEPWPVKVYPIGGWVLNQTSPEVQNKIDFWQQPIYEMKWRDSITAHIVYHDGSQGRINSRDVEITKMADGQNHIQTVVDYDKDGKLLVKSEFEYLSLDSTCVPGEVCSPSRQVFLFRIIRTDADGFPISDITNVAAHKATIKLNDGSKVQVWFRNLEDLLRKALRVERRVNNPQVQAIRTVVVNDLMNTFGFNKETLTDLMKRGLIKINVDLNNLKAKVTIDPSVQLPEGALNLIDPLGMYKLPGDINYQLGSVIPNYLLVCAEGAVDCHPTAPTPIYYLASGNFNVDGKSFALNYTESGDPGDPSMPPPDRPAGWQYVGDNRLHSVNISEGPICTGPVCPAFATRLIKDIFFTYYPSYVIGAHIVYHDDSQGDVTSRDVTFAKMEDGNLHVQLVTDFDKDGKVIVKSEFGYRYELLASIPECGWYGFAPCPTPKFILDNITRTDANGNPLSEIVKISADHAYVVLPSDSNDVQHLVTFKTLEELLGEALKLESQPPVTGFKTFQEALAHLEGVDVKDIFLYESRVICQLSINGGCSGDVFYSIADSDGHHYHTAAVKGHEGLMDWIAKNAQSASAEQAFRAEGFHVLLESRPDLKFEQVTLEEIEHLADYANPPREHYRLKYSVTQCPAVGDGPCTIQLINAGGVRMSINNEWHYGIQVSIPISGDGSQTVLTGASSLTHFNTTRWVINGDGLYAAGAGDNDPLTYFVDFKDQGDYNFAVTAINNANMPAFTNRTDWHLPSGYTNFYIVVFVDGKQVGVVNVPASDTQEMTGNVTLSGIEAGAHRLDFIWYNDMWTPNENGDANINFKRITIQNPNSPIEQLRTKILAKMDAEVQELQKRLEELKAELEAGKIQLAEDLDAIRSDVKEIKNQLSVSLTALKNLLEQEGSSDETRKAISDLSSRIEGNLNPNNSNGLEKLAEGYIAWLTYITLRNTYANIQLKVAMLQLYSEHRMKVVNANTLEELKALETVSGHTYPDRYPIPPPAPFYRDPREPAREYIKNAISLVRTGLLTKTDTAIQTTQKKLEELKTQLEAAKAQLAKDLDAMRSDATEVKNQMSAWRDALKNLLNQEGLSDETRKAITDLSSKITNYLDPNQPDNFDSLMARFTDQTSYTTLYPINLQIIGLEGYLSGLSAYKDQVAGAKTLEDLKALSDQFPQPIVPSVPMFPPMSDPRGLAKEYMQEAMPLLEKARDEQSQYQAVKMVTKDLVNSFGLSGAAVYNLIQQGLIKIEVDRKNLTAKITIDPSVALPNQADLVYLVDLLGNHKLPQEIDYQLGSFDFAMGVSCLNGYPCLYSNPSYYLNSGSFNIGANHFELNYIEDGLVGIPELPRTGDNRLHSVKVSEGPVCTGPVCPAYATRLIKDISFKYDDASNVIGAHIVYYDDSQGAVASRDVEMTTQYLTPMPIDVDASPLTPRFQSVTDYDKDGKVIVKSTFNYQVVTVPGPISCSGDGSGALCVQEAGMEQIQLSITRTDANGNPLSTIQNIIPAETFAPTDVPIYQANIVLPDGTSVLVTFSNLENLLVQALKVEAAHSEIEILRAALLTKIDSEVANAKKLIEDLKVKLEEAKVELAKEINGIHSDSEVLKSVMSKLLNTLKGLLTQEGLSEETKKALGDLTSRLESYLDPNQPNNFDSLMNRFIDQTSYTTLQPLNTQITMLEGYLGALSAYKDQVVGAKTLDELKALSDQFPQLTYPAEPEFPPMIDPRETAKNYINEAFAFFENRLLTDPNFDVARNVSLKLLDLFMADGISEDANMKIARLVFQILTRDDFYSNPGAIDVTSYVQTLASIMLDKTSFLPDSSSIRDAVIRGWLKPFEQVSDFKNKFKTAFGQPQYGEPLWFWDYYQAIVIILGNNEDLLNDVAAKLDLDTYEKETLRVYRILIDAETIDPDGTPISKLWRDWVFTYPKLLIYRFGTFVERSPVSPVAVKYQLLTGTGNYVKFVFDPTARYKFFAFKQAMGYALDWMGDASTRPNLLPDRRQIRRQMYDMAKQEGTLIAAYNTVSFSQNSAQEWTEGIMYDTEGRLNQLIEYAKEGKLTSLRIYLTLLDMLAYNTESRSEIPIYPNNPNHFYFDETPISPPLPIAYYHVTTDADHHITSIQFPDKTIRIEYTWSMLQIKTLTVEDATGIHVYSETSTASVQSQVQAETSSAQKQETVIHDNFAGLEQTPVSVVPPTPKPTVMKTVKEESTDVTKPKKVVNDNKRLMLTDLTPVSQQAFLINNANPNTQDASPNASPITQSGISLKQKYDPLSMIADFIKQRAEERRIQQERKKKEAEERKKKHGFILLPNQNLIQPETLQPVNSVAAQPAQGTTVTGATDGQPQS